MKAVSFLWLWLASWVLAGCSLTHSEALYQNTVANRALHGMHRVAIVPNRLPLLLTDPDQWRRRIWEIVRKEFFKQDIGVVEFSESEDAFKKGGLPLEDTTSAHDKYAQLCKDLEVDAIVIPYYATTADTNGSLFIKHSFNSLATFQIYLRDQNQFITRVDASGTANYYTGFVVAAGLISAAAGITNAIVQSQLKEPVPNATAAVSIAGSVLAIAGGIADIALGATSKDTHWTEAFQEAIPRALEPFFRGVAGARAFAPQRREVSPTLSAESCEGREEECEKSCKAHHAGRCLSLAALLAERKQPDRAIDFYQRACQLKSGEACSQLAFMFYTGRGVTKDSGRALEYIRTACSLRVQGACDLALKLAPNSNPAR